MKITKYLPLLMILIAAVATAQEASAPKLNLMPVPASVKFHQGERLAVDGSFRVATRGHSDARLLAGISRFMRRLEGRTVLTLARDLAIDDQATPLIIHCEGPGKDVPSVREDES